ncbi:MAG TPA: hypothetical protein ENN39_07450 [Desulfonatronum sp.]|nr:hypothetical protein [Desulfonatronum sp.]
MNKYASTLNFFCSLRLGFLNGLPDKDFFNTQLGLLLFRGCVFSDLFVPIAGLRPAARGRASAGESAAAQDQAQDHDQQDDDQRGEHVFHNSLL